MRQGNVSVTIRLSLEDAVEMPGLLAVAATACGKSGECMSEFEGGALSVTLRAPLKAVRGVLDGMAKRERDTDETE